MAVIIYKKDSLLTVGTVASNETVQQVIEKDVIPNFGGSVEEYDAIEVFYDNFHLKQINGVVVAEEVELEPQPKEPGEIELLNDHLVDVDYRLTLVELGLV